MPNDNEYKVYIRNIFFDENKMSGFYAISNYLSCFKSIRQLSLKQCGVNDDSVTILCTKALMKSKFLDKIDLSFNMIGDKGIENGISNIFSSLGPAIKNLNLY